jgi:hypothetical protein
LGTSIAWLRVRRVVASGAKARVLASFPSKSEL